MGKGRSKIKMKKIENLQARSVCFTKRRQGLFKKADELQRLFPECRIASVVFSPAGKPFVYGDPIGLLRNHARQTRSEMCVGDFRSPSTQSENALLKKGEIEASTSGSGVCNFDPMSLLCGYEIRSETERLQSLSGGSDNAPLTLLPDSGEGDYDHCSIG